MVSLLIRRHCLVRELKIVSGCDPVTLDRQEGQSWLNLSYSGQGN